MKDREWDVVTLWRPKAVADTPAEWSDRERLWELCRAYDERIVKHGAGNLGDGARKTDTSQVNLTASEKLYHLRWMLSVIPNLPSDGKVNRWLGFVQGAMFELGMYAIDELRGHVTGALAGVGR
jgi:hypothetical protein